MDKKSILPRGLSQNLWALFATSVISAIGFSITMPYMSLYLNNVLKLSMTTVGTLLMIAQVIGAGVGIYGGEISDKLGRKFIMVRSLTGRFVLFIIIGIIILKWENIYAIFTFLILNSIFFSFYFPASQAYIADITSEQERISAYGLLRMGGNLGWALGPAIGGLLASIDYAYLFFVTAFCMLIAMIILIKFCRESLNHRIIKKSESTLIKNQKDQNYKLDFKDVFAIFYDHQFITFTGISFLIFIVWGHLVSPISVYTVNRIGITQSQLGLLFSINGFMVVLFQYFLTHFIPDKKELDALWIGALIYAAGYLSIGFARSFKFLILSMIIITVAEMTITPSSQAYASKISRPENRGRYMAFYNLAQTFGWAIGPLLGGVLLDALPARNITMWAIVSAIAVLSAMGFIFYKNAKSRKD